MEYRNLEITIQYAEDLSRLSFLSKMDVYVVVSISGGDESSKQKTKTEVSRGGDANPTWSGASPMKIAVEEAALLQNRLMLDFKIKCERALGDRVIGEVHVPVKELLDFPAKGRGGAATSAAKNFVSYQVKKPSGKPKGKLTFSYRFLGTTTTTSAAPPPPEPRKSTIAYPVVETTPPYPSAALGPYPAIVPPQTVVPTPGFVGGLYPPVYGGVIEQEWYTPPPPFPPQGYFSHPPPPPAMQLAPDWWVVDWRYDARCSGLF